MEEINDLLHLFMRFFKVHDTRFLTIQIFHEYIVCHRKLSNQLPFLINHAYTGIDGLNRGMKFYLRTIYEIFSGISLLCSAQDFQERAFPRPIFSQQSADFSSVGTETDPVT